MCDNPDCGSCNSQARERIVDTGVALGDEVLDLLRKVAKDNNIDGTNSEDAYFFLETSQIALIKAATTIIALVSDLRTREKILDQFVANLTTMTHALSAKGSGDQMPAPVSSTLH
jgi:hypothetical protein